MNEITYLDYFKESYPNGRKPAKISQEKIKKLKDNYHINWKNLAEKVNVSVNNTICHDVAQVSNIQSTVSVTPSVIPQVSAPLPSVVPIINQPKGKNYKTIADEFSMKVYENSLDVVDLAGARKIRVSQKTKNEVNGYSHEMRDGRIENIVQPVIPSSNVNNVYKNVMPTNSRQNVSDFANINNSALLPSVDDYLQKDKPSQENGIIIQLAGDVESLKEETVKQSALLEQLEARYNDLKAKREQRIRDLEEEKLSYTATLEGLTERIKNLQEAIMQEEQSLSGYKK